MLRRSKTTDYLFKLSNRNCSESSFLELRILGFILFALLIQSCGEKQQDGNTKDFPIVLDENLRLELILEDPEIVTPIGLTIDSRDNLYVLESHTHSPPSDYAGLKYDRIKKGIDKDGDGVPEEWIVFADSISSGLNIAAGPDDVIYVIEKDKIKTFADTDQDGKSDEMEVLLELKASGTVYDHAGLLGIVYAEDDWIYVSRGNIGGLAWTIEGPDGSKIEGYGDGGNVFRFRPDGTYLEEVATGFWNPFDLKFTKLGKLLLADNDPDSRGPNRLIDVVPGGHYGYESLYGNSGNHPYLAWNGELPGTLPYAAALGEAPSGIIDAGYSHFPDYENNILATIWEENSIVRIPLSTYQSTVRGVAEVIIKGDSTFHPVALTANSKGDIYISDWVVREYPNHGKGRVWRLTAKEKKTNQSQLGPVNGNYSLNSRYLEIASRDFEEHKKVLASADVFAKAVARKALAAPEFHEQLMVLSLDQKAELRLQALLTLSKSNLKIDKPILLRFLKDENEQVRRMTLIHIGKNLRADLLEEVKNTLKNGAISPAMMETFLATLRQLQPNFIEGYQNKSEKTSKNLKRELPEGYLLSILEDKQLSDEIRAATLPYLDKPSEQKEVLLSLISDASKPLKEAILYALKSLPDQEIALTMAKLAQDPMQDEELRAIALVSLGYQAGNYCKEILPVLQENKPNLTAAALRYLCRCTSDKKISEAIEEELSKNKVSNQEFTSIWQLCQGKAEDQNSINDETWNSAAEGTGDAIRGKLIFQMASSQCQLCHKVNGWGGEFGPDLSNVSSSKSREQLIKAILAPSEEISPEWQGWYVKDQDGQRHEGRQIDVGNNEVELMISTGNFKSFKNPQSYGMVSTSLMPEGLESSMTSEEFNHLITYLMTLK